MPKLKFVKSHYNAPWRGVIVDREKRKNCGDLLFILVLLDRHGNKPKKRITAVLDENWTTECEPIDLSEYNPDWFINIEFRGGYLPYEPLNYLEVNHG